MTSSVPSLNEALVSLGVPDTLDLRMRVEAALDWMKGRSVILVGATDQDAKAMSEAVVAIRDSLGGNALGDLEAHTHKTAKVRKKWPGEVIYVDPYQGAGPGQQITLEPPYSWIRTIQEDEHDLWRALDYEGTLVMTMTEAGGKKLRDMVPERIEMLHKPPKPIAPTGPKSGQVLQPRGPRVLPASTTLQPGYAIGTIQPPSDDFTVTCPGDLEANVVGDIRVMGANVEILEGGNKWTPLVSGGSSNLISGSLAVSGTSVELMPSELWTDPTDGNRQKLRMACGTILVLEDGKITEITGATTTSHEPL